MEIIDNFLTEKDFEAIEKVILSEDFAWYYNDSVSYENDGKDFYFTHMVYNSVGVRSHLYEALTPLLNKLNIDKLIRIKVNLYPKTNVIAHHNSHVDTDYQHKGAILYMNSNDGLTVLKYKSINSIKNRVLLFDPSKPHNSTTCTDKKYRININVNYL
jgi:hypothetical protein